MRNVKRNIVIIIIIIIINRSEDIKNNMLAMIKKNNITYTSKNAELSRNRNYEGEYFKFSNIKIKALV